MSIRAQPLTLVMRYTLKRLLENFFTEDPKKFRGDIRAVARFEARLPDEVDVSSEEANSVPSELISYGDLSGDQVHLCLHGGGYLLKMTAEHLISRVSEARTAIIELSEFMRSHMSASPEVE